VRLPLTSLQQRIAAALTHRRPTGEGPTLGLDSPQWAAVTVLIAPDPESVLLIRRAEREGDPWSGHMGLPGGRLDPADADLLATAMRETVEEVGCALSREWLLGALDDVWPRSPIPRLIVVRPYVFGLSERLPVTLSDEVEEAFWVPLAELRRPDVYRDTVIRLHGEDRAFPAYHLEPGVVWGLTERILTPLLSLL
jgi:8-oxo-dGTP pyrophosphatase MutT (NUDIX family)